MYDIVIALFNTIELFCSSFSVLQPKANASLVMNYELLWRTVLVKTMKDIEIINTKVD